MLIRSLVAIILVAFVNAVQGKPSQRATEEQRSLEELIAEADTVVRQAERDAVTAEKNVDIVFAAANALAASGEMERADQYFAKGLQISPWKLTEQLNRARLLTRMKRGKEAKEIAGMVWSRAETDKLCDEAAKLLGKPAVTRPPAPPLTGVKGPWICFVNVGPIDWQPLHDLMKRLQDTIGIPVYCADSGLGVGAHDRSALNRWVQKEIVPSIPWDTDRGAALFEALGVKTKAEIPPEKLLVTMIAAFQAEGRTDAADSLELSAGWFRMWDRQWNASLMLDQLEKAWKSKGGRIPQPASVPGHDNAIVFGITACDIYDGDLGHLFGTAYNNERMGLISTARFQAAMLNEPPDRRRFVARTYRQCLSSIGFAIGVPRPTDPTSARSFINSVQQQDAKSEHMSEECIAGFERALGIKLPKVAHKPADAR
jgi:predicted Zn-dependent protease